jgi:hypothetical protein
MRRLSDARRAADRITASDAQLPAQNPALVDWPASICAFQLAPLRCST